MFWKRKYSLRKSRHILKACHAWYEKKKSSLAQGDKSSFESLMEELDQAILQQNRQEASRIAKELEPLFHQHRKRSPLTFAIELGVALIVALAIAVVVRSVWFEIYQIPTGSMRPSFRELDNLTVSKTAFGINVPMQTKHFYFDPNLVKRGRVLIFSGDQIADLDSQDSYFGILPYTKRYIKRLIGKPGDTLYFYGGKIYGIDKNGDPIPELLDDPWMQKLEHVPFLQFETMKRESYGNINVDLMNRPIGKLTVKGRKFDGKIFDGKEWIADNPIAQRTPHDKIETYSDIWGIRNYAMARLMTKKELKNLSEADTNNLESANLYLELRHTPSLNNPQPRYGGPGTKQHLLLSPHVTAIPLKKEHINAIMDHMYTSRFVIKDERARSYGQPQFHPWSPIFYDVPDGTYELFDGIAYKVGFGGTTSPLPKDHPLYDRTPSNIQKLFNVGIEMSNGYQPYSKEQVTFPHRYVYFRDGDLYLMGAPTLFEEDPTLVTFNEREIEKEEASSENKPYIAYRDYGPPIKDGTIHKDFIEAFGLTIPEKQYLVLGDNHAMSADSRVFGFVPEENIQGVPSLIIWPFGSRWGMPPQTPYPFLSLPRLIIWALAAFILSTWYLIHRRNLRKSVLKPSIKACL